MTLYVQSENYHFDGYLSGVIVDEANRRVALYNQSGILGSGVIKQDSQWYELESVKEEGGYVEIKAKNFGIYRKFFCLNKVEL